jgi:hypothetical protein
MANTAPPITVEDTAMGTGPLPSPEVEGLHGECSQKEKGGGRDGGVEFGDCGYWFLGYRVGVALALPGTSMLCWHYLADVAVGCQDP